MKNSKIWIFLKGLIAENPVLVLVLGTCPTLAVTNNVLGALCMGIAATAVLICSNVVISALRNIIPDTVRIPCYIVVISTFVTVVDLIMNAFMPDLHTLMGTFLKLIVVNCIILGRAEMYASKNGVLDSAIDAVGMGIGFTLALFIMASIREILGSGSWFGLPIPWLSENPILIFGMAPGGFFVFGCLIALVNKLSKKKNKKDFSCESCPSAYLCGKRTDASSQCKEGDDK